MIQTNKKDDYQLVRIKHVDTYNSARRVSHGGNKELDEDELSANVFCLELTKDCKLCSADFKGSALDYKLPNMFFRGAKLEINFLDNCATVTVRGTMDCKINGKELEEDRPFRLTFGDVNEFFIDDEAYVITYLKRGAYSRRGSKKSKSEKE
jgi:hypothetical protein